MPVAQTRLEQLQVLKLLQSVRAEDRTQIEKLATNGIPDLINYSGIVRIKKCLFDILQQLPKSAFIRRVTMIQTSMIPSYQTVSHELLF